MGKSTETQAGRRVKYGSNVIVAAVAAILLVGIVNAIAYKRLVNVRFDLTSTRRWSLSQQTTKVVSNLKNDYRMVVLIGEASPFHMQAKDLINEYGYLSDKLTIETINPASDSLMERFYGELVEAYGSEVTPMRQATDEAAKTLETVRGEVKDHLKLVRAVLEDKQLTDQQLKAFIQNVSTAFASIETEAEQIDKSLEKVMESALPDFAAALNLLKDKYEEYDKRVFQIVIEQFNIAAENPTTPAAVKDKLLRLVELVKKTRGHITPVLTKLENVKTDGEYSKLRNQIGVDTVVLMGPKDKPPSVIHLGEMFKEPDPQDLRSLEPGEQPERRFLGEEKVTGALVAMELDTMPMVVFVAAGQRPAIGFGGEYRQLAARLRAMNFEVTEWPVAGRMGPMGQPAPGGPPPQPAKGQKALWVVPPLPPVNPMQPGANAGNGQKIADHLKGRLAEGDAAMISTMMSPMAAFGGGDPIVQLAKDWGVTVQNDRVLLQEVVGPRGKTMAVPNVEMTEWTGELPVTEAIGSMIGLFYSPSPLVVDGNPPDGTTVTPLVVVKKEGMWAETDLQSVNTGDAKFNEATAADQFTIAAAIEKDKARMIIVGDPMWASDQITTYGLAGPGTAHIFGARFPANAELFMNSAYWLLGLDELIAAGARSQDIRRIDKMDRDSVIALRWILLLGLPGLAMGAGVGVWLVRRRV